jgi:hypothetical protein
VFGLAHSVLLALQIAAIVGNLTLRVKPCLANILDWCNR